MNTRSILCSSVLALSALPVEAQMTDWSCGSDVKPAEMPALAQAEDEDAYLALADDGSTRVVAIRYHIVRNGGPAIPASALTNVIANVNPVFAPAGITFTQVGAIDYIDNATYFNITNETDANALRGVNATPNAIDIYFVESLFIAPFSLLGLSSFVDSSAQGIIMDEEAMSFGEGILIHELGHYFNLFHTHETMFGQECPNGSNSLIAGDLLADTPADPDLFGRVSSSCSLTGPLPAPPPSCGVQPYTPDLTNYMSYTPPSCLLQFTSDQYARMRGTLLNLRPELAAPTTLPLVVNGLDSNSRFGEALAVTHGSGTSLEPAFALVGAPGRNADAGAVYVKAKSSLHGPWNDFDTGELAPATPPAAGDQYGAAVAFDGQTALVGAPGDGAGAVHFFQRTFPAFTNEQVLYNPSGDPNDGFGTTVAVYDELALVGAPFGDGVASGSGLVYVYERDSLGVWSTTTSIVDECDPFGSACGSTGDEFGAAVDLSGNRALIGAPGWGTLSDPKTGRAFVYERDSSSSWSLATELDNPAQDVDDAFASSVSLFGDVAVAASEVDAPFGGQRFGVVHVFELRVDQWFLAAILTSQSLSGLPLYRNIGCSVDVTANALAIGARLSKTDALNPGAGAVLTAVRATDGWYLRSLGSLPHAASGDELGATVALSGVYALAASPFADTSNATPVSGGGTVQGFGVHREDPRIVLTSDVTTISNSAGGAVTLSLDCGSAQAGTEYRILGSITGTLPGIPYRPVGTASLPLTEEHTAFLLPLKYDSYFQWLLNVPAMGGNLDAVGQASLTIPWPANFVDPSLLPITYSYSYVLQDVTGPPDPNLTDGMFFASRPVQVTIVP